MGGCTPGKINLPTVCSVRLIVFRLSLSDIRALRLLFRLFFFFDAKIGPTHACEFNSPSWYDVESLPRLRLISKVVKRSLREQDAGEFDDRRAYSFDTVYNYV